MDVRVGRRLRMGSKVALAAALTVPLALPVLSSTAGPAIRTVANVTGAAPLPATASQLWQTNGTVWTIAYSAGKIYLGGEFTKVRPPGVPIGGKGEVAANRIAAFNATTGAFIPTFKHTANSIVYALTVAPDGKTLYLGGDFTNLDGKARTRVGAIDLTTAAGALKTWAPKLTGNRVKAISVNPANTAVYLGGRFTAAEGQARSYAAAYTPAGALLPWAPQLDSNPAAVLVTPKGNKVALGGGFNLVNGELHRAVALVDAGTGATEPTDKAFPEDCSVTACTNFSTVRSFTTDGTYVYLGAEGTGYGWFDGTMKLDPDTGQILWRDNCLGATQAVQIVGTQLYIGSHSHDCTDVEGGFPQAPLKQGWHHLISEDVDTGIVQPWFPNTNAGPGNNPNDVGPRSLGSDGTQLFVGGSFTTVNGVAQQGITRFVPNSSKGAVPVKPTKPIATSNVPGKILVKWTSSYDLDDGTLTYRLYRDGKVIATFPDVMSRWWLTPTHTYLDSVASGTHNYRVDAVDAKGNVSPKSDAGGTAVAAVPNGGYPAAVAASNPSLYWSLDDAPGSATVADASGHGQTGTAVQGVTFGAAGVTPGTNAADVDDPVISLNGPAAAIPNQFSMELWFKTTSHTGGRLMGFGDSQSATSSGLNYDPFVYLNAGGQLLFAYWDGPAGYNGIWGAGAYNDGSWHHLVATNSGTRLTFFIDGVRQDMQPKYSGAVKSWTGWFRVGTDSFAYWPLPPKTAGITATIDDVALYPRALTATEVLTHFRRAG